MSQEPNIQQGGQESESPSSFQEKAPTLEMMESAKNALLTFCMYYYQALRQHGHDVETSKRMVADEITNLYDRYAQAGRISYKPNRMRDPKKLLDEIIEDAKALGIPGRAIYQKLIDFKQLIE